LSKNNSGNYKAGFLTVRHLYNSSSISTFDYPNAVKCFEWCNDEDLLASM